MRGKDHLMRKIIKYALPIQRKFTIHLPRDAELLTVDVEHGNPCLWAIVEEDEPWEPHVLLMVKTGESIAEPITLAQHVGTFTRDETTLHVFELPEG